MGLLHHEADNPKFRLAAKYKGEMLTCGGRGQNLNLFPKQTRMYTYIWTSDTYVFPGKYSY